jgi:hypothetical protein
MAIRIPPVSLRTQNLLPAASSKRALRQKEMAHKQFILGLLTPLHAAMPVVQSRNESQFLPRTQFRHRHRDNRGGHAGRRADAATDMTNGPVATRLPAP